MAHRGAAVRLQLAVLREEVHEVGRAPETLENTHGREEVRLSYLQQTVHEIGSFS